MDPLRVKTKIITIYCYRERKSQKGLKESVVKRARSSSLALFHSSLVLAADATTTCLILSLFKYYSLSFALAQNYASKMFGFKLYSK